MIMVEIGHAWLLVVILPRWLDYILHGRVEIIIIVIWCEVRMSL
jgi:hypothetical protein